MTACCKKSSDADQVTKVYYALAFLSHCFTRKAEVPLNSKSREKTTRTSLLHYENKALLANRYLRVKTLQPTKMISIPKVQKTIWPKSSEGYVWPPVCTSASGRCWPSECARRPWQPRERELQPSLAARRSHAAFARTPHLATTAGFLNHNVPQKEAQTLTSWE